MLNRSQIIQLCITCLLISGTILSCSGHPAQRRTLTIVDRLMRANPLRNLAKYFGQRFSMEMYYPPPPLQYQQQQQQQQPGPSTQQTHYVKVPMWQPIYYSPPVAMIAPHMMQQQNPQILHGYSYPMPQAMIQPAVSAYKPVISEPLQQNPAYYLAPPSNNQISQNGNGMLPNNGIVYSQENNLYNNGDDSSGAGNMVRIIVIQPTDLDKMKSMPESDLMNGYTMKYIELNDDTLQEPLTSQTQDSPQQSRTRLSQNQTCVEPLCDPFLRKLIPELLPSSTIAQVVFQSQENNNNNQTLRNTRDNSDVLSDLITSESLDDESSEEEDSITMVKALEDPNLTPQVAPTTTNPPRTHKKPISARINSTSLRKYEPRPRQMASLPMPLYSPEKVHHIVHKLTHNHLVKANMLSSPDSELIPSETSAHFESSPIYPSTSSQNFQRQTSFPHRYGTNTGKQRMFHYTAGVVFNKSKYH